jgi:hypothetical protein
MPSASQRGWSQSSGEITPAVSTFTMPETKPCSDAAIPRRVGKRSSVMSEIDGAAMAKPTPKSASGITAQGIAGVAAKE